jgi:hypothetical protein
MSRIYQVDIARRLALPPMAISRAVEALGHKGEPLTEHVALLLLTAGEINGLGLAWPIATDVVRKFNSEIRFLARDAAHRTWIVFIERADREFQITCVSPSHLDSVLQANPLSLVLALHEPVALSVEALQSLQQMKGAA